MPALMTEGESSCSSFGAKTGLYVRGGPLRWHDGIALADDPRRVKVWEVFQQAIFDR